MHAPSRLLALPRPLTTLPTRPMTHTHPTPHTPSPGGVRALHLDGVELLLPAQELDHLTEAAAGTGDFVLELAGGRGWGGAWPVFLWGGVGAWAKAERPRAVLPPDAPRLINP